MQTKGQMLCISVFKKKEWKNSGQAVTEQLAYLMGQIFYKPSCKLQKDENQSKTDFAQSSHKCI